MVGRAADVDLAVAGKCRVVVLLVVVVESHGCACLVGSRSAVVRYARIVVLLGHAVERVEDGCHARVQVGDVHAAVGELGVCDRVDRQLRALDEGVRDVGELDPVICVECGHPCWERREVAARVDQLSHGCREIRYLGAHDGDLARRLALEEIVVVSHAEAQVVELVLVQRIPGDVLGEVGLHFVQGEDGVHRVWEYGCGVPRNNSVECTILQVESPSNLVVHYLQDLVEVDLRVGNPVVRVQDDRLGRIEWQQLARVDVSKVSYLSLRDGDVAFEDAFHERALVRIEAHVVLQIAIGHLLVVVVGLEGLKQVRN